ncbi:peptide ligase PGM1-related protein [Streptomyces sp. I05A-00742]|uniref:preATP grasp domain-containing protein n=1 Tax=Streptomyces sp. I05A-00742 TaxID=2732853 RepID=UPI0014882D4F|nr:peptide ligase PGM1-related protein [Streptomyces sp. I05A-00742]
MTALLIGNNRAAEMTGGQDAGSARDRERAARGAQRLLWWARDGDVLLLPTAPDDAYLDHVTGLTGTRRDSLTFVTTAGANVLAAGRADPGTVAALRTALAGRPVERVVPVYADTAVTDLVRRLGAEQALPGWAFHAQGGSALVNSKAAFRAVAAGTGVPVPAGTVASTAEAAAEAAVGLLADGHCAVLKREFHCGGLGNEILTADPDVRPLGAPRTVVLSGPEAARQHVTDRWEWLSSDGRHRPVVERYHPDSLPVYAEFEVDDAGVVLSGHGEMLMDPVVIGETVPAALPPAVLGRLTAGGRRLCEAYRAVGYRGTISADAILTPAGELLFSETNGRLTGSSHLHTALAARLVGERLRSRRVLLETGAWPVPSFRAALDALDRAGLAFDPDTRTGVVLVGDLVPADGTVIPCVIAPDRPAARAVRSSLPALFAAVRA